MKSVKVSPLSYEMLAELAKKRREKTESVIESLIKQEYEKKK